MSTDARVENRLQAVVSRREDTVNGRVLDRLACGHELQAVRLTLPTDYTYRRRCAQCGPYTEAERRGTRGHYATDRDGDAFKLPAGPTSGDGGGWVYVLIYAGDKRVHVREYDDDGTDWQVADCGKQGEVRRLRAGETVLGGMPMPVCRTCQRRSPSARRIRHAMTEHHRHYPRGHK